MSILSVADTIYTFRFLKLLVTPWKDTPAYALGVIDSNGGPLIKVKDLAKDQREVYSMFHRLVFKIKRLMNKVPGGKSQIGSYAAALWLIKEETKLSDQQILSVLAESNIDFDLDNTIINESFIVGNYCELLPGVYKLTNDIVMPSTGEELALEGTSVICHGNEEIVGNICGLNVYKVQHTSTKQYINVTSRDLTR